MRRSSGENRNVDNENRNDQIPEMGTIEGVIYEEEECFESSTGLKPITDDYNSNYNFKVFLKPKDRERGHWLYSKEQKLLYTEIGKVIVISFQVEPETDNDEHIFIRALPVDPGNLEEPIKICSAHLKPVPNEAATHHFLRADHPEARYHMNKKSGRNSVTVRVDKEDYGSDSILIAYNFACKTTCTLRRPIDIIFTL